MSRTAATAQFAPFIVVGATAGVGAAPVLLEAGGGWVITQAGARGVSSGLVMKYVGTSLFAGSAVSHFASARDEAKAAGIDPNSPLGFANTLSAAVLRAFGIGELGESS